MSNKPAKSDPVEVPTVAASAATAPGDVEQMRQHAREATALLKAMGNEDRLLILCTLSQGELSVGELEARTQIHQPTLSQQLTVLRAQGMVSCRRDGRFVYYAVCSHAALATIETLYGLFCARSASCVPPPAAKRARRPPS